MIDMVRYGLLMLAYSSVVLPVCAVICRVDQRDFEVES